MKSAPVKNLDGENARRKARAAIKSGRLIKTDCATCGDKSKKTVAHHDDYSRPLDVIFLCEPCHKARHRKLGWGLVPYSEWRSRSQGVSVNLYLSKSLVSIGKDYVTTNRKHRSLSSLIEMLLVRELGARGVKLPAEFATKPRSIRSKAAPRKAAVVAK